MKLDSFREILLKKSSNNEDLQSFIQNVSEDTLHKYVSDLLEKAIDPNATRHTKPNAINRRFAGGLTSTNSKLLYSQLSHHASKYIAASKAHDAETDPQKKSAIRDTANKHAAAFMTSAALIQKISKDASSNENKKGTNHTEQAPVSLRIGIHSVQPWQRHKSTSRKPNGKFTSVCPGLAFKGRPDFFYLHKKPHPEMPLDHDPEDPAGSNRKNSSYPIQDTKIYFKNNHPTADGKTEYEHHINIDPEEKFSGKFEPHIMDSHPIFGMHDHGHADQDHFLVRNGEHNTSPNHHGGFVHTPQDNFPEDGSHEKKYNDLLKQWTENVLAPSLKEKSYKGNPLFRAFASEKSSERIPLREDGNEYGSENKLAKPRSKSLATEKSTTMPDEPKMASKPTIGPAESEEGHVPDEHLDNMISSLESDPEAAKSFLSENPHYGWVKDMLRPQEGEEGHISDEHLPELLKDLASNPDMAQSFTQHPSYGWLKRRVEKEKGSSESQPKETEAERVQRRLKEIDMMDKSHQPKIGVESLLKSISLLLKKNESFFSQNPELFIAVQERFVKAVTDEEDLQDEEDQQGEDQQELTPEDIAEAGRTFNWDDPEAEDSQDEDATEKPKSSASRMFDTNHLTPHGAKYLGLNTNQKGRMEVLHDPDIFSLIRGHAAEYSGKSEHADNLENEKNTIKHAGAKINSSDETKAHQSRQDAKNKAWADFKNSKEYQDILTEHGDPDIGDAMAEIAFGDKWAKSGEHEKDLDAHRQASAKATTIHNEAKGRSRSDVEERRSFLGDKPIKSDDTGSMKLEPDFKFNHSKTVDGKEYHDVSQGDKMHGTVVHDPKDPSKTQFNPSERSAANPDAVLASFNQEKDLQGFNKELEAFKQKNPSKREIEEFKQERGISSDDNNEESDMSGIAPEGFSSVDDISSEGEAKANIYDKSEDGETSTGYKNRSSSGQYFKQTMQDQKPASDRFQFNHNPSASSGSIAHHDVFHKDENNQPIKVGTIVHDVKDPNGPKFMPHEQSSMNPAEAVSAFKSKGIKYTEGQVKSLLNPEQSKRFDLVQGAKTKKGSM